MSEQSFASHAHHPVPTYIAGLLTLVALITSVGAWLFGWPTLELAVVAVACAAAVFVGMSRTYTTSLQDRIILLEMKVRAAELLPPAQRALLAQLTKAQVVALRFASDDELGELVERTARERLAAVDIKRAIRRWRPDHLRT